MLNINKIIFGKYTLEANANKNIYEKEASSMLAFC